MAEAAVSRKMGVGAAAVLAICFAVAVLEGYDIQAFGVSAPRFGRSSAWVPRRWGWRLPPR